jgi:hypothetical protein
MDLSAQPSEYCDLTSIGIDLILSEPLRVLSRQSTSSTGSIKRFIDSEFEYLVLSLIALIVSLLVSIVIFLLVERPAQKIARDVSFERFIERRA